MLTLISHGLCPYVQRAAIALTEKQVPFKRVTIDLADKPGWFLALSPLGKTPVLLVGDVPVFESAVILDYLEETAPDPLYPADPLARAGQRGWIAVASAMLDTIAGLYNAPDPQRFETRRIALSGQVDRLEQALDEGPFFAGAQFGLVDCAFAPVFRYFDVIDRIADLGLFEGRPKTTLWRKTLSERASVIAAVGADYPEQLLRFLKARGSYLSELIGQAD